MVSHALLRRGLVMAGGGVLSVALALGGGTAASATGTAPSAALLSHAPASVKADTASGTAGLNYVALGDSYSAGFGNAPYVGDNANGCFQSENSFPRQMAAALGLTLTDATCSGATTANILNTPQVTPTGVSIPPQLGALSASTNVVTVTIGGNDLGFADIAASCAALSATGPIASNLADANCKALYVTAAGDSLKEKIDTTVTASLKNTFEAISKAAPNAKVFVLGYPALAPDAENTPTTPTQCFSSALGSGQPPYPTNSFPFTNVDVPYLNQTESELDNAIQTQSVAAGATFVPLFAQTQGNTPCDNNVNADLFGITLQPATNPPSGIPVPGLPTIEIAYGALHPNPPGMRLLASAATSAVSTAFPAPTAPTQPVTVVTGPVQTTNTAPMLAESGSDTAPALTVGALVLLAGTALLGAASLRRRRAARRR